MDLVSRGSSRHRAGVRWGLGRAIRSPQNTSDVPPPVPGLPSSFCFSRRTCADPCRRGAGRNVSRYTGQYACTSNLERVPQDKFGHGSRARLSRHGFSLYVRFNQLHSTCQTRIQQKKWCPQCECQVDKTEIVKGYEFEKGRYVVMDDEDIAKARPESTRVINLMRFADVDTIDRSTSRSRITSHQTARSLAMHSLSCVRRCVARPVSARWPFWVESMWSPSSHVSAVS